MAEPVDDGSAAHVLSTRRRPTLLAWVLTWVILGLVLFDIGESSALRAMVASVAASILIVGTLIAFVGLRRVDVNLHSVSSHMTVTNAGVMTISLAKQGWSEYRLMFPPGVLGPQLEHDPRSRIERAVTTEPTEIFAPYFRRGRYKALPVVAETTDPFGIWRVTHLAALIAPSPFWVCPDRLAGLPIGQNNALPDDSFDGETASAVGDTTREIVPYVPGDRPGQIHWASTARKGELMTRRFDSPNTPELSLVVRLSGNESDDVVAGRALGTIDDALLAGSNVTLTAMMPSGPVTVDVTSTRSAAELLAAVVPGDPRVGSRSRSVVEVNESSVEMSVQ